MLVLVPLSIIPILFSMRRGKIDSIERNDPRLFTILAIIIIIIMGLRSRYIGSYDTNTYCSVFENARNYSNIIDYFKYIGIENSLVVFSEFGFYSYVWFISKLTSNYVVFLLVTSAIMIYCVFSFIKDNSDDWFLSAFMFITQGELVFYMNGMRQAIAMSICLLSYKYAKKKRFIAFVMIILLAMLFHKTSFVFLVVFIVSRFKINWKSAVLMIVSTFLICIFADRTISYFSDVFDKDYVSKGTIESGGFIVIVVYSLILLVAVIYGELDEEIIASSFWLTIIAMVLFSSRYFISNGFERVSYYYAFFSIVLFPNTLSSISPRNKLFLKSSFVLLSIILFAYRTAHGSFADFSFSFVGG